MSARAPGPVDPALVARFSRDVERLRPIGPDEWIALAVSGGPDSMAMLVLAAAAYPGRVVAATVDHGLRAEGADEARMVAGYAARLAVPHTTLRIVEPPVAQDNVHAWARERRYERLSRWASEAGARCLATAHHTDDQAETFLMRAARGSGVAGLAGIRALRPAGGDASVAVIRPLLGWRVAELRALVVEHDVPFVDDPSNVDPRYDRTRVRALLRDNAWLDPVQIARAAAYAGEADATLGEIEAWLWNTRLVTAGSWAGDVPVPSADLQLDIADLPGELKRRLARRAIHAVRATHTITQPAFTDSTNIEPLLDALEAGKSATQAGVLAAPHGTVWNFARQPPRRTT